MGRGGCGPFPHLAVVSVRSYGVMLRGDRIPSELAGADRRLVPSVTAAFSPLR